MKILLDHNLPVQLKLGLPKHSVFAARDMGWETLKNGSLLAVAEEAAFDVLITGDQNLTYQQNQLKRKSLSSYLIRSDADWAWARQRLSTKHWHALIQAVTSPCTYPQTEPSSLER